MYKVFIVEDEKIIRDGLVNRIPWGKWGFEVCGEAPNGKVAMDFILSNDVDVVLTDVRMPVIDGLILAKNIRQQKPFVKIIVLSGYGDFTYAQQSIEFGVSNYVLKPLKVDKLFEAFSKLKTELDDEKQKKRQFDEMKKKIDDSVQYLGRKYLKDILNNGAADFDDLTQKLTEYRLCFDRKYFICSVIAMDNPGFYDKDVIYNTNRKIAGVLDDLLNDLSKYAKYEISFQFVEVEQEKYILIINFDDPDGGSVHSFCKSLLDEIASKLKESDICEKASFSIGIGETNEDIREIRNSYLQALEALEFRMYSGQGSVNIYGLTHKITSINSEQYQAIKALEEQIINLVSFGDEKAVSLVDDIFYIFLQNRNIEYQNIRNSASRILYAISDYLKKNNLLLEDRFAKENAMQEFTDIFSIKSNVKEAISYFVLFVRDLQKNEGSNMIRKAKQYVKENYMHNITLGDISERFYINESYFSWLFKENTGMTFSSYITEVRMNKAKELLKERMLKVYEVANKVGYSDYRSFSNMFKKTVGTTPLQYKKKVK